MKSQQFGCSFLCGLCLSFRCFNPLFSLPSSCVSFVNFVSTSFQLQTVVLPNLPQLRKSQLSPSSCNSYCTSFFFFPQTFPWLESTFFFCATQSSREIYYIQFAGSTFLYTVISQLASQTWSHFLPNSSLGLCSVSGYSTGCQMRSVRLGINNLISFLEHK